VCISWQVPEKGGESHQTGNPGMGDDDTPDVLYLIAYDAWKKSAKKNAQL
jgi:hypothetical protein